MIIGIFLVIAGVIASSIVYFAKPRAKKKAANVRNENKGKVQTFLAALLIFFELALFSVGVGVVTSFVLGLEIMVYTGGATFDQALEVACWFSGLVLTIVAPIVLAAFFGTLKKGTRGH